jgi:hypothetical protein
VSFISDDFAELYGEVSAFLLQCPSWPTYREL